MVSLKGQTQWIRQIAFPRRSRGVSSTVFTDNQRGRQTPVAVCGFCWSPPFTLSFLSHSETFFFPGLIPLFCSELSHSCFFFVSQTAVCLPSLSLERGVLVSLYFLVTVTSASSCDTTLPPFTRPLIAYHFFLLTSHPSFHQYVHRCHFKISERISLPMTKSQLGLETLCFSSCNKEELLMGTDCQPPWEIQQLQFFGCITWTRQMCLCFHSAFFFQIWKSSRFLIES